MISRLVTFLSTNFALKNLGSLSFFLGLEAKKCGTDLYHAQSKYIQDLLARVQIKKAKHIVTQAATKHVSLYDGSELEDRILYRSTIGALQYILLTRP